MNKILEWFYDHTLEIVITVPGVVVCVCLGFGLT